MKAKSKDLIIIRKYDGMVRITRVYYQWFSLLIGIVKIKCVIFLFFVFFPEQIHQARWPLRPWDHQPPTVECTHLYSAQRPWGPQALSTLPSVRWALQWMAWLHPSLSSAHPWALTPWTRLAWATVLALAPRWGLLRDTFKSLHFKDDYIEISKHTDNKLSAHFLINQKIYFFDTHSHSCCLHFLIPEIV